MTVGAFYSFLNMNFSIKQVKTLAKHSCLRKNYPVLDTDCRATSSSWQSLYHYDFQSIQSVPWDSLRLKCIYFYVTQQISGTWRTSEWRHWLWKNGAARLTVSSFHCLSATKGHPLVSEMQHLPLQFFGFRLHLRLTLCSCSVTLPGKNNSRRRHVCKLLIPM